MEGRLPLFIYQAEIAGRPLCVSGGAANHEGYGVCLNLDEDQVVQGLSVHKAYGSEKQECVGCYGAVSWSVSPVAPGDAVVFGGRAPKLSELRVLDIYQASKNEPMGVIAARLRDALRSNDQAQVEVYLRILGER